MRERYLIDPKCSGLDKFCRRHRRLVDHDGVLANPLVQLKHLLVYLQGFCCGQVCHPLGGRLVLRDVNQGEERKERVLEVDIAEFAKLPKVI